MWYDWDSHKICTSVFVRWNKHKCEITCQAVVVLENNVIQFTLIHRVLIFFQLAHTIISNFDKIFKLFRRVYQFSYRYARFFCFLLFFIINKTITNRVLNQQLPLILSDHLPLNIFNGLSFLCVNNI